MAVHQDDVVGNSFQRFDGFHAVGDRVRRIAKLLQLTQPDLLVHDVVLGHQNAHVSGVESSRATGRASRVQRVRVSGGGAGCLRHDRGQAIKKAGFFDGFDQIRVNASAAPGFRVEPKTQRRQHHQAGLLNERISANGLRQGQAVHLRHLQVQNDKVESIPGGRLPAEQFQRNGAVHRRAGAHFSGLRLVL